MKFQNNWHQKCLENLPKENFPKMPDDESSLVLRVHRLRKLPLGEFQTDDIRFMIIQEERLAYMLALALPNLQQNLYAEGNYYKGDLLNSVLNIQGR